MSKVSPAPTAQAQVQVQCPQGAAAGSTIQVPVNGQMLQVVIPPGVGPGQTFMIAVPAGVPAGTPAAVAEDDYEPYEPLPDIRFDVSDPFEQVCSLICCPCMGWQTKTLLLTDQEVTFRQANLCGVKKQKRPYAQLGSVDKHQAMCFTTLVSDFSPLNEKGEGGLKIGCCGTDSALTDRIVAELQNRKHKRGGIGQIKKLDYVLGKMAKLGTQAPLLLDSLGIKFPARSAPSFDKETMPTEVINVNNTCEQISGCIICAPQRTLTLEAEEAVYTMTGPCGCYSVNSKREYGQLGFVEKQKECIICFKLSTDISPIPGQSDMVPGCPCSNRAQVSNLVQKLRQRMSVRGQTGQIKKQEQILRMIGQVEEDMKLMMNSQNIAYPPPQNKMQALFGDGAPDLNAERPPVEEVENKIHDVTSTCDSWITCCATCGCAGCTTETMRLEENDMYITTKNNLDESDVKIPYTEMDSVDVNKTCCCCFMVNEQSPGFGCDKAKVETIADDLQERKFKRGNIAHLKQLRAMQGAAVGIDVMATLMLEKEGVAYPPSQQVMNEVFPNQKPRALIHEQKPHIQPSKEFDTKNYSVTNWPEFICGCCTTTSMELGPDEMLLVKSNPCSTTQSRTPYGNLGAVETETMCCCCATLPDIATPGCGCSGPLVDEIAGELQDRKEKRGNIAQMKQQENIIVEVLNTEAKMEMLMNKRSLQYPPAPEVMRRLFPPPGAAAQSQGVVNVKPTQW